MRELQLKKLVRNSYAKIAIKKAHAAAILP